MYAIIRTGGKQYRVQEGQHLLVERLPEDEGATVELEPLLFVNGADVIDRAAALADVTVSARIVAQERGPKLRIVKFKPKRGYKRRTGHRQNLSRIEILSITGAASAGTRASAAPVAAGSTEEASDGS